MNEWRSVIAWAPVRPHSIKRMFHVPESAPTEDKAICQLVNSGMNPSRLYKAAYTFYRAALEEQLTSTQPVVVQSGLFKGMILFPGSLSSQLLPKWLGTYEAEVQGLLEEQAREYDCFIDIGCAEGFYLTGIARWLGIPCHGCDIDPRAHSATAFAAQQNGVAELVHLHTSTASAVQAGTGRALILVDVDGHEKEVLEELTQALSKTQSINEALLILETDKGQSSTQNTAQLITWLCQDQWNVIHIAHQNPQLRFRTGQSELSFLDQVVRGAEGRPGGQRWIMATKQTPQQRSNLASSSVA